MNALGFMAIGGLALAPLGCAELRGVIERWMPGLWVARGDGRLWPVERVVRAGAHPGTLARWRVRVLLLIAWMCAVLLVGAAAAESGARAAGAARGSARARIVWRGCGERLQCARVRVPLDWARPDGPKITLAVIRYLASGADRRIGSLFVNFGGPGSSGVAGVRTVGATLDALGQGRFDVVSWDPRGAGASTHVRCFADARSQARFWERGWSLPTTKLAAQRWVAKTVVFAKHCAALSGALLAHVSTADTARDLDYLRRLVGDRQLTYLGISYGTLLGQTYANLFPDRVRAMVLDGVVDPVAGTSGTEAALADGIADTDLVFAKFQALCQRAGPARCALAGGGPVARRVSRLVARLRRGPIPAPSAAPPRQLSYGDLLLALFGMLPTPAQWPQLADGLAQAASGDGSALETGLQQAKPSVESGLVAAVALQCADEPPPRQGPHAWPTVIDRLTRISKIDGPVDGWLFWAPCASWSVASAHRYTGPWNASTPNPILISDTRFDPNTPFADARRAARRLPNAVLLTQDGYGHTIINDPSQCVDQAASTYLVHLTPPPRGTICRSDRTPFDPNFGNPLP